MLFASIDRSSQRHRVTGHWRRPSLSPCLSSLSRLSLLSLSHPHPPQLTLSAPFSRSAFSPLSLSLSLFLRDLSLSAYLVLNYPNSISVQLQFIPVSKRQSRRVHFASALPPGAIISFLFISSPFASSIRLYFVLRLLPCPFTDWPVMMNVRFKLLY